MNKMGISVKSGLYCDWIMTRMGISVTFKSGLSVQEIRYLEVTNRMGNIINNHSEK